MRTGILSVAAVALFSFSSGAFAQNTPDVPVGWGGYTWNRDRYEPDEFQPIGPYQGRSDALRILLGPDGQFGNRDANFQFGFYNTQGRKAEVNLPGSSFVTGDLYIPGTWATQQVVNWQATGLWGSVAKAPNPNNIVGYSIVSFSNSANVNGFQGGPIGVGGRFAVFDDDTGVWHALGTPVNYDAWNTLRFEIHPDRYEFFINGTLVYTDTVVDIDAQNYLKEIFLNSVNNNVSAYEAFWANVMAGLLANPANYQIVGSVPGMSEFYQVSALGDFVSRRGLSASRDFSLQEKSWAYVGGLTGQFETNGASGFDGNAYFARFGSDIVEPLAGLRLGVTGSTGKANTDDATGSAEADYYSAGGYLTYVDKQFYVDVLTEYSWARWDVGVNGQSNTDVNVRTFVGSAEAGASLWLSKFLRLVPNAQAVLLSSDYDDATIGNVQAKFDSDDSVIGRAGARFQYELPQTFAGAYFYLGASIVKDLAGNSSTLLQSPTFAANQPVNISGGAFDEAAALFAGGFDLKFSQFARLYTDATYITGGETDAFRGTGGVTIQW